MVQVLRRIGVALGSFVAAVLCVGLVGGIGMAALGVHPSTESSAIATLAALVLGWLIDRDIMRRERPRA